MAELDMNYCYKKHYSSASSLLWSIINMLLNMKLSLIARR